jgi:hypothetical protein
MQDQKEALRWETYDTEVQADLTFMVAFNLPCPEVMPLAYKFVCNKLSSGVSE